MDHVEGDTAEDVPDDSSETRPLTRRQAVGALALAGVALNADAALAAEVPEPPLLTGRQITRSSVRRALQAQGAKNVDHLVNEVFQRRATAEKAKPGSTANWWVICSSKKWCLAGPNYK